MARLTWLVDELKKAGLRVVAVDGWATRGSAEFDPEGVTWHATAGSRTATAQGEVNVILNGSTSAPPPIAQLMIWRDGTVYVCAAGRCNHNKVGWAGPNKGLGNTQLLGIEMANDNRGEAWPAVQLDAARRATAAIMRRFNADPARRLAGHYEHQPYAGRPAGETSTKSDPFGVDMAAERKRVSALIAGGDELPTVKEVWNTDNIIPAPGAPKPGTLPNGQPVNTHWAPASYLQNTYAAAVAARDYSAKALAVAQGIASKDQTDEGAIAAAVIQGVLTGVDPERIAEAIVAALPQDQAERVVELLAARMAA